MRQGFAVGCKRRGTGREEPRPDEGEEALDDHGLAHFNGGALGKGWG